MTAAAVSTARMDWFAEATCGDADPACSTSKHALALPAGVVAAGAPGPAPPCPASPDPHDGPSVVGLRERALAVGVIRP
jgi:hypothetical protein